MDIIGKDQIQVLVVLPGNHGIQPIDLSRKEGHALVLCSRAVQGDKPELKEVGGFHELRHHHPTVIGGEGGVVHGAAIFVLKPDEPGVFYAVPLRGRSRKDDARG